MRLRGIRRIKHYAKRFLGQFSSRALILLYHSVAETKADPWSLSVSPHHFAEHLDVLRRSVRVMRLEDIARSMGSASPPRRAVAVTFDDGYANNLYNAKPLLERFQVPATVFLTTGYMTDQREFWWDELERLLFEPLTLPQEFTLAVSGSAHRWKLDETVSFDNQLNKWRAWQEVQEGSRYSLYQSLYHVLHPLSESERRVALDDVLAWAGARKEVRPTHRPLSIEEAIELANGRLVEIGCHTVTHTPLSSLSPDLQRAEIARSKSFLEDLLGRRVKSFAYPYGKKRDYSADTVSIVKQTGFDYACAAFPGSINRGGDIFQLPRIQADDCDGDEFARRLSSWFLS